MFFRNVDFELHSEEDVNSNDESISDTQDQNVTRPLDENEIPLVDESAIIVTDNVHSNESDDSKITGINLCINFYYFMFACI